ncbi:hypothetical protein Agabi119p4_3392 [Agaricus bisporus var. burnettii]|uniref:Uncharacterized protein n=1 Tax=Agaricus bisporus var. burnettii TaxID=192524 RepID=A0A8H7KJ23_AGABI|nr:hypothetical protein Agabi119p4_3392 [Agaricus bisporus var. burnettii]
MTAPTMHFSSHQNDCKWPNIFDGRMSPNFKDKPTDISLNAQDGTIMSLGIGDGNLRRKKNIVQCFVHEGQLRR